MTAIANAHTEVQGGIKSKLSVVKFDRPADILAYLAGDVISASTETAAAMQFRGVGRSGALVDVHIAMEETDTVALEMWVFDSEPTNFVDSAPFALVEADAAKVVAVYSFADAGKKSAGGFQHYMPDLNAAGTNLHRYVASDGTLWGLLVTRSAFTPASAGFFAVTLHVEAD